MPKEKKVENYCCNIFFFNLCNQKFTCLFTASSLIAGDGENVIGKNIDLGITAQYLIESCQSGALTCLVCISKIRRQNEVKVFCLLLCITKNEKRHYCAGMELL